MGNIEAKRLEDEFRRKKEEGDKLKADLAELKKMLADVAKVNEEQDKADKIHTQKINEHEAAITKLNAEFTTLRDSVTQDVQALRGELITKEAELRTLIGTKADTTYVQSEVKRMEQDIRLKIEGIHIKIANKRKELVKMIKEESGEIKKLLQEKVEQINKFAEDSNESTNNLYKHFTKQIEEQANKIEGHAGKITDLQFSVKLQWDKMESLNKNIEKINEKITQEYKAAILQMQKDFDIEFNRIDQELLSLHKKDGETDAAIESIKKVIADSAKKLGAAATATFEDLPKAIEDKLAEINDAISKKGDKSVVTQKAQELGDLITKAQTDLNGVITEKVRELTGKIEKEVTDRGVKSSELTVLITGLEQRLSGDVTKVSNDLANHLRQYGIDIQGLRATDSTNQALINSLTSQLTALSVKLTADLKTAEQRIDGVLDGLQRKSVATDAAIRSIKEVIAESAKKFGAEVTATFEGLPEAIEKKLAEIGSSKGMSIKEQKEFLTQLFENKKTEITNIINGVDSRIAAQVQALVNSGVKKADIDTINAELRTIKETTIAGIVTKLGVIEKAAENYLTKEKLAEMLGVESLDKAKELLAKISGMKDTLTNLGNSLSSIKAMTPEQEKTLVELKSFLDKTKEVLKVGNADSYGKKLDELLKKIEAGISLDKLNEEIGKIKIPTDYVKLADLAGQIENVLNPALEKFKGSGDWQAIINNITIIQNQLKDMKPVVVEKPTVAPQAPLPQTGDKVKTVDEAKSISKGLIEINEYFKKLFISINNKNLIENINKIDFKEMESLVRTLTDLSKVNDIKEIFNLMKKGPSDIIFNVFKTKIEWLLKSKDEAEINWLKTLIRNHELNESDNDREIITYLNQKVQILEGHKSHFYGDVLTSIVEGVYEAGIQYNIYKGTDKDKLSIMVQELKNGLPVIYAYDRSYEPPNNLEEALLGKTPGGSLSMLFELENLNARSKVAKLTKIAKEFINTYSNKEDAEFWQNKHDKIDKIDKVLGSFASGDMIGIKENIHDIMSDFEGWSGELIQSNYWLCKIGLNLSKDMHALLSTSNNFDLGKFSLDLKNFELAKSRLIESLKEKGKFIGELGSTLGNIEQQLYNIGDKAQFKLTNQSKAHLDLYLTNFYSELKFLAPSGNNIEYDVKQEFSCGLDINKKFFETDLIASTMQWLNELVVKFEYETINKQEMMQNLDEMLKVTPENLKFAVPNLFSSYFPKIFSDTEVVLKSHIVKIKESIEKGEKINLGEIKTMNDNGEKFFHDFTIKSSEKGYTLKFYDVENTQNKGYWAQVETNIHEAALAIQDLQNGNKAAAVAHVQKFMPELAKEVGELVTDAPDAH